MARSPLLPLLARNDPAVRPEYLAGTWAYAVGRPAYEHPKYRDARRAAKRWNPGWIRSWSDVEAVLAGCWFDEDAAMQRVDFFPKFLRLTKGKHAGQSFKLIDYQQYDIIMPLFGWKRDDGLRRFRKGSVWMPKKNAKSAICSGIEILMLTTEKVDSPEIYTAAGDRQQASIIHDEAAKMIRRSEKLRRYFRIIDTRKTIVCTINDGVARALSAEAKLQEGLHWLCVLFDELHVQPNRMLFTTLAGGGIANEQSLFLSISTAGEYNPYTIGWEEWEYNRKVREGLFIDWQYFAIAYYSERDADWRDRREWVKANPGYGITFPAQNFDSMFLAAQHSAMKQNDFRRYHLNQWLHAALRWTNIEKWNRCNAAIDRDVLRGRECYGGFDGAGKLDLNSFTLAFAPLDDGRVATLNFNFTPAGGLVKRITEDKVPYDRWAERGDLEILPGNSIDQRFIAKRIIELSKEFDIREIAFDPGWSRELENLLLDEGMTMVEMRQTMDSYTAPMHETERLIVEGLLCHGNNEVLNWAMDNLCTRRNWKKQIMPDKESSTERIDPACSLFMAIARMMVHANTNSSYNEEGVMVV